MVARTLSQQLHTIISDKGLGSVVKTLALIMQRSSDCDEAILKVSKTSIFFSINGKVVYTKKDSEEIESSAESRRTKEDAFLQRISHANIKVPLIGSFDATLFHDRNVNIISSSLSEYETLVASVAQLEIGIQNLKKISGFASIFKQIFMYLMYTTICELESTEMITQGDYHLDVCKKLNYLSHENKRLLRDRLRKIKLLGELVELFGEDILLIPKLGISKYFAMNKNSKEYIRLEVLKAGAKLGNFKFEAALEALSN